MSSIQLPPLLQDDPGPGHEHRPPGPIGPITYQILLEPSVDGWFSGPPNPFGVSTLEGRRPMLEMPEWVELKPVAFQPPSRATQSPAPHETHDMANPLSTNKTIVQSVAQRSLGRTARSVSPLESQADAATGPLTPSSSSEGTAPPTRKRRGQQPYYRRVPVEVCPITDLHRATMVRLLSLVSDCLYFPIIHRHLALLVLIRRNKKIQTANRLQQQSNVLPPNLPRVPSSIRQIYLSDSISAIVDPKLPKAKRSTSDSERIRAYPSQKHICRTAASGHSRSSRPSSLE
ncbi:hypothetical protein SISSUDRAFT_406162 [Sistotremastrum suecicum HHB10207 ss-3]|uniref:Uncharacterized protein n=1 Tax=Sistotremastrum suecicum HHB10207 ss-3 TaxID=1314776 RepID=A0A165YQR7_9AGAM|nr:hypothetical protein SISSUDRAFT_406162 [Sistotremastrum suecicum HHB10207 ss-3]